MSATSGIAKLVGAGLLCLLAGLPAHAVAQPIQQTSGADESTTQRDNPDLPYIAEMLGVTEEEAAAQMELQDRLDQIEYRQIDSGFAQVSSTPGSKFRVQYYTASSDMDAVAAEFRRLGLEEFVDYKRVPFAAGPLERAQELAIEEFRHLRLDSSLDIPLGEIVMRALELPDQQVQEKRFNGVPVRWERVEQLAVAEVGGGRPFTPICTGGFVVENVVTGNRGLATAGHCMLSGGAYEGYYLTLQGRAFADSSDVEWHDNVQTPWGAAFYAGPQSGSLPVTRRLARSDMNIGDIACKYGQTTGRTCGNIVAKNVCPGYVPSCDPTFVQVHNSNNENMSSLYDSGGPTFNNTTALGIHSGGAGLDAIFMPQQYVNALGVRVVIQ